jgi:hypothetical protein
MRMMMSRRMRWVGRVACVAEKRNAYRTLKGTPEGERPLGTYRRRWENNIKMNVREIEWGGMNLLIWFRTGISVGFL